MFENEFNKTQNVCPCPNPIELITYLEKRKWDGLNNYKPLLIHRGTRQSMNIVWRMYHLGEQIRIEREREKEAHEKMRNDRKKEYHEELDEIVKRMRELSERLELERNILLNLK